MKYDIPISIIIPIIKDKKNVGAAIKSILNQSYKQFELIIIQDSSTGIPENETKWFGDSRIRFVKHKENMGDSELRNLGLLMATGKYVCMLGSDDIALSDRLRQQYEYLESHPSVGCIGGACETIDNNNKVLGKIEMPLSHPEIKVWLLKDNCVAHSTIMIRNHLIKKYRLYYNENLKSANEYDFIIRISQVSSIRNLNKVLIQKKLSLTPSFPISSMEKKVDFDSVRDGQLKLFGITVNKKERVLHSKLMEGGYIGDSDLKECESWLNRLYEANHLTKYYNKKYLYQLFENLLALAIHNNSLGGWSIEREMLNHIENTIPKGNSILEFGSGVGTEALLKNYRVTSIEHDDKYAYKRAGNHKCILAPIHDDWFKKDLVKESLKKTYDLVIVDGPPLKLRKGILKNLDLFKNNKAPVIFDDVNRTLDKEIMLTFCKKLNYNYKIIEGNHKAFAFCLKVR
jgi:glycosyltransferase involved in cell wall biosynthesis